ncbi:transporter substrate-binding domain-containing protein [Nakamurella deserti]|uniref:transporter substrate-binding domain-containing protein n=1 Tax=Nakamurella deserti TaxID=2164074 RepID=UPI00197BBC7C|nr:transporter substrate-binding domain-containing protein [Nakamurella deserti]
MNFRRSRSLRTVAIAAAAVGTMVLTACAPDSSNSGTPTSSSPAGATTSSSQSAESPAESAETTSSGSATSGGATGSTTAGAASPEDIAAATASLIAPGSLTVCTHLPYAPFQSNDDSGKAVGFDIDMMDLVAEQLGVTQAIVDTPFEGIKSGQDMATGKCDIAAAGMTITEERSKVILFSEPYFDATQALLVRSADQISSLEDLRGKRLGAQAATTGLDYANANKDQYGYEIVEYTDLAAEQQALTTNQIDAAINDLPVWSEFIKGSGGSAKIAAQFDTGEQYGFGMKLGNDALKAVVDSTIAAARADGTYDELYAQWIGDVPAS